MRSPPRSRILLDEFSLFLVTSDISPELISCAIGLELGATVNWLWPFMVLGQIYGHSNFGHNFCQVALL